MSTQIHPTTTTAAPQSPARPRDGGSRSEAPSRTPLTEDRIDQASTLARSASHRILEAIRGERPARQLEALVSRPVLEKITLLSKLAQHSAVPHASGHSRPHSSGHERRCQNKAGLPGVRAARDRTVRLRRLQESRPGIYEATLLVEETRRVAACAVQVSTRGGRMVITAFEYC